MAVNALELEAQLREAPEPEGDPEPGWLAAFERAEAALLSLPVVVDADLWLLPGWSRLLLLEAIEAWTEGRTGCDHAPDWDRVEAGLAVAWSASVVVCGPCAVRLGRCPRCSVCGGPATSWPVVVCVPLGLVVAACRDCMRDFPA